MKIAEIKKIIEDTLKEGNPRPSVVYTTVEGRQELINELRGMSIVAALSACGGATLCTGYALSFNENIKIFGCEVKLFDETFWHDMTKTKVK